MLDTVGHQSNGRNILFSSHKAKKKREKDKDF